MKEEVENIRTIEMEFSVNTSPNILFQRLYTPHGLSEWFADDVNLSGNIYTFIWEDNSRKAELVEMKTNKMVKFRWLTDEESGGCSCFAFRITKDELTGDLSLIVTEEFSDEEDIEGTEALWEYQINELKRAIGV